MGFRIDGITWRRSSASLDIDLNQDFEPRTTVTIAVGEDHQQSLLDLVMRCWELQNDKLLAQAKIEGADPMAFL